MARILVQNAAFDLAAETASLAAGRVDVGGIASFLGVCRGDDGLTALVLEHYPGMTERAIARIVEQAEARWPLTGCTVIHRTGWHMALTDPTNCTGGADAGPGFFTIITPDGLRLRSRHRPRPHPRQPHPRQPDPAR